MSERRPSSTQKIGIVPCPKCKESGLELTGDPSPFCRPCSLCNGGRAVAVDAAIQYTLEHGDTEPPPKEE